MVRTRPGLRVRLWSAASLKGARVTIAARLPRPSKPREVFSTALGTMYQSKVEAFLDSPAADQYRGEVQLLMTSPPFPLNRKKKYGNEAGPEYLEWLAALAPRFAEMLKPDGSIVIELGNGWEPGSPTMSTLSIEALLEFKKRGKLNLCQQFIWQNPATLPSPVQWVNIERQRVKNTFTHLWWMAPNQKPKADNRRVLVEYSESMKKLIKSKSYNAGKRPSEYTIGETSFLTDNKGAIPGSVLTHANTGSSDEYRAYCKRRNLDIHPARMPGALPAFFINFLTDVNDLVFDPFGGSCTTGEQAELLGRRWVATEPVSDYVQGAKGRFLERMTKK
jgi:DNA modification methylase